MDNKFFQIMVTRDATVTALLPIAAADRKEAMRLATSRETTAKFGHCFTLDDPLSGDAYLGDPDEGLQEVSEEEYLASLAKSALPEVAEPFELVVAAHATNEFANGPEFAVLAVDTAFIRKIMRLRRVIFGNGLDDVGVTHYPDWWHKEESLIIRGDTLRVTSGGSFWVEGHPKHRDWDVETRAIDIDDFLKIVSAGPSVEPSDSDYRWIEGRLFYGSSLDWLVEAFTGGEEPEEEEVSDE